MVDPLTGESFESYSLFWQLGAGGLLAFLHLGLLTPVFAQVFLFFTAGNVAGQFASKFQTARMGRRVGRIQLPSELIVRKKTSDGSRAAIPVTARTGSGLRRLFARVVDDAMLLFGATGGLLLGAAIDANSGLEEGTLLTESVMFGMDMTFGHLSYALAVAVSLIVLGVQAVGVARSGRSPGHTILDLQLVTASDLTRPGWRGVFRYTVLPLLRGAAAVGLTEAIRMGFFYELETLRVIELVDGPMASFVIRALGIPFLYIALGWVSGLPLIFGYARSAADTVSGTRCQRLELGDDHVTPVAPMRRFGARAVDMLLPILVVGPGVVLTLQVASKGGGIQTTAAIAVVLMVYVSLLAMRVYDLMRRGQTPGRRWFGLHVVSRTPDRPTDLPSFGQVVLREFPSFILLLVWMGLVSVVCGAAVFQMPYMEWVVGLGLGTGVALSLFPLFVLFLGTISDDGRSISDVVARTDVVDHRSR